MRTAPRVERGALHPRARPPREKSQRSDPLHGRRGQPAHDRARRRCSARERAARLVPVLLHHRPPSRPTRHRGDRRRPRLPIQPVSHGARSRPTKSSGRTPPSLPREGRVSVKHPGDENDFFDRLEADMATTGSPDLGATWSTSTRPEPPAPSRPTPPSTCRPTPTRTSRAIRRLAGWSAVQRSLGPDTSADSRARSGDGSSRRGCGRRPNSKRPPAGSPVTTPTSPAITRSAPRSTPGASRSRPRGAAKFIAATMRWVADREGEPACRRPA